jgi:hypothetical protein
MHFGDPRFKLVCKWHKSCDGDIHTAHRFEWVKVEK